MQSGTDAMIIDNVPFHPQEKYQCGPASLAGVLNFWGVDATPEDIANEIFSRAARGTLNIDMLFYAQRAGLYAEQYAGSWHDLTKKIDSGYPLIVLVDFGFSFYQANHFMVVVGYNNDGIIVNSEKTERMFIPKDRFLRIWERANYWTLLIKQKLEEQQSNRRGLQKVADFLGQSAAAQK
jgi:ABC-type bacteriocin/lantibiotic exporter with double-glycine peptidase domain